MDLLRKDPKIALSLVLGILGQFFNFIGLCVVQSGINSKSIGGNGPNPLGLSWFWLVFYIFYTGVVASVLLSESQQTYRFVLLALTVMTLGFIPFDIQSANTLTPLDTLTGGAVVRILGLVILFFPTMFLLFLFGSEQDSVFNTAEFNALTIPSFGTSSTPAHKTADMESRPVSVADSNASSQHRTPVSFQLSSTYQLDSPRVNSGMPASAAPINSPMPQSALSKTQSMIVFKAQAMYAYEANAADPNEISFKKGEILNVLNNKGKWWQVQVERNGSVISGIAPSNYLSPM